MMVLLHHRGRPSLLLGVDIRQDAVKKTAEDL
jgi:hypothetical protein